ncbi:MAG: LacI family DNA-binding transcriptional regulator, partial [Spirochaetaceae bacterium]|nr:LacI family DNA-binding transcriptional regulator [Spirochaetaceae bacterium]
MRVLSMKVTIKDIAEQAGVSIATVSHVINATRYVSPELVEKVERVIKE